MDLKYYQKLIVVFVIAFIADMIACIHIQTLIDNAVVISAGTILILHLMPFFEMSYVIDTKSYIGRFGILLAGGLGAALGTTCVILLK